MKVSVCILNYNMPQMTDELVEHLREKIKIDYDLIVVDNGSDMAANPKSTTHRFEDNRRVTGGLNRCLYNAKGSDAVWLLTNDSWIDNDVDPLQTMLSKIKEDTGVVHPSLIPPTPEYYYKWMLTTNKTKQVVECPMVDMICPLYTKKALDTFGWKFDERFEQGWGIDYDSCYTVRQNGLKVLVDFDVVSTHKTSTTYKSGKDPLFKNKEQYYKAAYSDMTKGLTEKYGRDWKKLILG
jgi:glycosyltransferase involved in cell wall biosynthesis